MPLAQYMNQATNVRITHSMPTPKKITRLDHWFRHARKAIPAIPDPKGVDGWYIEFQEATQEWVRFDMKDRNGLKCNVVIFRKVINI